MIIAHQFIGGETTWHQSRLRPFLPAALRQAGKGEGGIVSCRFLTNPHFSQGFYYANVFNYTCGIYPPSTVSQYFNTVSPVYDE